MDSKLLDFAQTDVERRALEAVLSEGSHRKAAKKLGRAKSAIDQAIARVKKNAARQGYSPEYDMTRPAPPGYMVKGVSTLYNKDGAQVAQWVKTNADRDQMEALMREAVAAMAEDIPRLPPLPLSYDTQSELCNCYVITDFHLGMLAWHKEGGADWDLKIAEKTLIGCFEQLLAGAPPAGHGIVCQLGDFLHSDGMLPVTPTSGHILDQDGRFSKIVNVAIRSLRRVVDMALMKHETVHVVMAEGNHDRDSSIWIRAMFSALYEDEPRVTVDDSVVPYYVHQHGSTMLGFHHGHMRKFDKLTGLFAAQFPKIWGATEYRYGHTGHFHHTQSKEDDGMVWTQHQTLAAKDAYAARGGYHARRAAKCETYHKRFGLVGSNHVTPEMI